jgi:hypothetical protein
MFGKVWASKWLWGMFGDDINGHKGLGNVWGVTSCIVHVQTARLNGNKTRWNIKPSKQPFGF